MREWLAEHAGEVRAAAVFDTCIAMSALITGRASRKIANRLRGKRVTLIAPPESFLVTKQNQLLPGELDRARSWAAKLADAAVRG